MANSFLGLDERIDDYLMNNSLREPDVLRRLREETDANNPHAGMAVSPIQGQFMALLVKLIGAVKTLEVGVFAGAAADYRLHGLELDGALLRASPQVASRDLVIRWQGGLRLRWRRLVVEHSLHAVSREVAAGRGQHVWGRLGVALWR